MNSLKITLVKSLNGRLDKHIATAQSLGLHKIGDVTVQPNNPQTQREDCFDRLSSEASKNCELRRDADDETA